MEKAKELGFKVIAENEEKNAELVKQSCADTISLMSSIFERLPLKGSKIEVCQHIRRFSKQIIGSTKN